MPFPKKTPPGVPLPWEVPTTPERDDRPSIRLPIPGQEMPEHDPERRREWEEEERKKRDPNNDRGVAEISYSVKEKK